MSVWSSRSWHMIMWFLTQWPWVLMQLNWEILMAFPSMTPSFEKGTEKPTLPLAVVGLFVYGYHLLCAFIFLVVCIATHVFRYSIVVIFDSNVTYYDVINSLVALVNSQFFRRCR